MSKWWIEFAFMALFAALILGGSRGCDACRCDEVGDATGRDTQFRVVSGCYVEVGGRWVPLDSWRGEQER